MRLRPMSEEDLWLRIELETDASVMEHLGGPRPVADIERAHAGAMREAAAGDCWALLFMPDGEPQPAGWVSVFRRDPDPDWEIGWMTRPAFQGRGLASEAVSLVLQRAREERRFSALFAYPNVTNIASNRICEKNGFTLVGRNSVEFAGHQLVCNVWRADLFEDGTCGSGGAEA